MSLYGALFSGVSGLTAQASAMSAISDNITNVSTIGYKGTETNFQTLVTKQTSSTFYSAGGVQSKPRQQTDVQGLLQASTSQTDLAMSGGGFFVVNKANVPGISDPYLFTRAGSFIQDSQGYLKNAQGFYLQGWPTDPAGTVIPANPDLSITNQNIISSDYLGSINLNRVGGTAAATNDIAIGANLPSSATVGQTSKTDIQFFNSLGNANNLSIIYSKTSTGNQWNVDVAPPPKTEVTTLYDNTAVTPLVYSSGGLVEFNSMPAAGSTIKIGFSSGTALTYTFQNGLGSASGKTIQVDGGKTLSQVVAALVTSVQTADKAFSVDNTRIHVKSGVSTAIEFNESGVGDIYVNLSSTLDSLGAAVTNQTGSFTVQQKNNAYSNFTMLRFENTTENAAATLPLDGTTIAINGKTYEFDSNGSVLPGNIAVTVPTSGATAANVATVVSNLKTAIAGADPVLATSTRLQTFDLSNNLSVDTLKISTVQNVIDNVDTSGMASTARPVDGDRTAYTSTTIPVATAAGIIFNADGLPKTFNVGSAEILGFTDGAQDMNNATGAGKRIKLDFGTTGQANGMTQFGGEFTPAFITQNGSKFGTFAGVTIGTSGLVTALFDNGETRKIFQIPIATFVNPNQLGSQSGNVWTATQASGDYTLRVADSGPAGQVTQSALEASTVDIGTEFTKMIVVQRAYSASTKIISTADQMLQELMQIKR